MLTTPTPNIDDLKNLYIQYRTNMRVTNLDLCTLN